MITTPIALDTLGSIAWTAADLLALGPLVTDGVADGSSPLRATEVVA